MHYFPQYDLYVSWPSIFAMVGGYLGTVYTLKFFMDKYDVTPFGLKNLMRVYNFAQVILNVYMIYGLSEVVGIPNIFGINRPYSANLEFFCFVHFLSKALDYFDTVFIILRKKYDQLSVLHVYHHASIGMVWAYLLQIGHANGTASYGAFINSVIHFVMYSHYFIRSIGLNNPFKRLVTSAQITQFYSCMLHAVLVPIYDTLIPKKLAIIQLCYHTTMIYLFTNFYNQQYKSKKSSAKKSS